jgi:hypothetical protein
VENGSLVEAGQPLLYVEPGPAEEALDALPAAAV